MYAHGGRHHITIQFPAMPTCDACREYFFFPDILVVHNRGCVKAATVLSTVVSPPVAKQEPKQPSKPQRPQPQAAPESGDKKKVRLGGAAPTGTSGGASAPVSEASRAASGTSADTKPTYALVAKAARGNLEGPSDVWDEAAGDAEYEGAFHEEGEEEEEEWIQPTFRADKNGFPVRKPYAGLGKGTWVFADDRSLDPEVPTYGFFVCNSEVCSGREKQTWFIKADCSESSKRVCEECTEDYENPTQVSPSFLWKWYKKEWKKYHNGHGARGEEGDEEWAQIPFEADKEGFPVTEPIGHEGEGKWVSADDGSLDTEAPTYGFFVCDSEFCSGRHKQTWFIGSYCNAESKKVCQVCEDDGHATQLLPMFLWKSDKEKWVKAGKKGGKKYKHGHNAKGAKGGRKGFHHYDEDD